MYCFFLFKAFHFATSKDQTFFPAVSLERDEEVRVNIGQTPFRFPPEGNFTDVYKVVQNEQQRREKIKLATNSKSDDIRNNNDNNDNSKAVETVDPSHSANVDTKESELDSSPLDLDSFKDIQELVAVGLIRLKNDLQWRNLKTGGTVQERAERLW